MEKHISVLLNEVITSLDLKEDDVIVDATLGYGGHSSHILERIKRGSLFAFDQDQEAIDYARGRLSKIGSNFTIIKSNFKNMKECLAKEGILEVDGILFDLGVSSPQLDDATRGFSYHQDARLDMRMDQEEKLSAYEVVNQYQEAELVRIFFEFGEEKFARSIARNIVKRREEKPIESTLELAEIIKDSVPEAVRRKAHPARKVFQAIRIEVNHELDILEGSLKDAMSLLKVGGRLSVITFHSLEDRICKNVFKEAVKIDPKLKGLPNIPEEYLPNYRLVYRHAIEASEEELNLNNRARSAKLRVIERIK